MKLEKNDRTNPRWEKAIAALLEHATTEKAAAALNISSVTLWRWLQQPEFQSALRAARRQAYSQAIGRLEQASATAVNALLRVMTDATAPHASRIRAADCVLSHAARAVELEDVERRVAELERFAQTQSAEASRK